MDAERKLLKFFLEKPGLQKEGNSAKGKLLQSQGKPGKQTALSKS